MIHGGRLARTSRGFHSDDRFDHPLRARLAAIVFPVAFIVLTAFSIYSTWMLMRPGIQGKTVLLLRGPLNQLRASEDLGPAVEYKSDAKNGEAQAGPMAYCLTRYLLAPTFVRGWNPAAANAPQTTPSNRSTHIVLILVNATIDDPKQVPPGFAVEKQFGDHVYLLRGEGG